MKLLLKLRGALIGSTRETAGHADGPSFTGTAESAKMLLDVKEYSVKPRKKKI